MQKADTGKQKLVYGLDIGTRSIVGTVGYMEKSRFVVVAQRVREHETRAMIDGQIHDISAVGETIREVTDQLELDIKEPLHQVCIAAAGRVLRTVTTHVDIDFEGEKVVAKEDIFALDSYGVEKAYEEFQETNSLDMKFYCVGYTVMRYFMNDYPMSNLENHKAKTIAADLIATFLPEDVVDGLYKAVELADLEVANLTLEPIAAMEVAIPQMYRMLNIALIDVGAGTSDISITKDGSIVAYGMLPIAGDCMTEDIARHCLVDFATAEEIKRNISTQEEVEYKDIMGLPQTIARGQVLEVVSDHLQSMTEQAADLIMELNGDKPVSAVFVVGGGGKIEGYTDLVAKRLGIAKERCALRGEEVMQKIDFLPEHVVKDSMLVTPIGICLNYYEQSNNFMFVTFNGQRIKLYDNNRLAVVDAAMQAEFYNEDLFPKRGEPLTFTFNGKQRVVRGERGESAQITLNGNPADIHTAIRANDVIAVSSSTAGAAAHMELGKLAEYQENLTIHVNGIRLTLPKFASVNGRLESPYYEIQENDVIDMLAYYTVQQVIEVMDVVLDGNMQIRVNHEKADMDTKVYDNFTVEWTLVSELPAAEERVEEAAGQEAVSDEAVSGETAVDEAAGEKTDRDEVVSEEAVGEEAVQDIAAAAAAGKEETGKEDLNARQTQKNREGGGSVSNLLEKARASAQQIASAPVTQEVEQEMKKAQAYAAAERISAFATAYNQTGAMPPQPKKPAFRPVSVGNMTQTKAADRQTQQAETKAAAQQTPQAGTKAAAQQTQQGETQTEAQQTPQTETKTAEQQTKQTGTQTEAQIQTPQDVQENGTTVVVTVNGGQVVLSGKPDYIYVDVFDYIDFDLSKPQGKSVETLINGRQALYVEPLKTGDVLDIFWKE